MSKLARIMRERLDKEIEALGEFGAPVEAMKAVAKNLDDDVVESMSTEDAADMCQMLAASMGSK